MLTVVSQNYFTTLNPTLVRKLTNKKIRWIISQLEKGTPVKEIAAVMRVTPRRIYQLKKQYEETGNIPELKQPGRKPKQIDSDTEKIVLEAYQKYKLSPVPLEKLIERDYGIHIPHNTINFTQTRFGGGGHEQEEKEEMGMKGNTQCPYGRETGKDLERSG